ncbi:MULTISPECIES: bifunctional 23S rRNA (guanine(2069)-N(7))-methyltransferase RlmK/23S rRNA (guanine(2445)-N(2))-methyltransferase RlmL [unclassified Halomonas]|uniref:bifunctional 23S rRNA (guanine(2069)-N(7))-methyltransferase RlmK/23S rRNA (guanine(2445)-N(2))-methyltransferase RlmL n=1 Tax=unclassified Halomonas TaxID=2609666 RepID=UPI002888B27C|nr:MULTISPECIES: bifunctional 23S rRNA (guanine(2069)-N(7))-methyltransferase RlmK/23S rRNA (guanine(2445)-N(2))-methyltransferase RlmL [unclassified Halomonas]MDT0500268.1 bifunctional 23S rRNA (guanine(2069)-N(7))-methyltransferase RlmK/23S rRNA (guanine(2445)-N(2))-methyltransferase RlmL [Halomonas sp. PAR7]MDT0511237.1 bifunctional 23S rRNA (guanine(2069)-N(7))-methyltransferase RlmK/23S rRNA (guanine(2445)-N(2))-methyltransferase RlmL [Halomonas sp. LES1]MDT0590474.1 bifunctional 23S rRNA (
MNPTPSDPSLDLQVTCPRGLEELLSEELEALGAVPVKSTVGAVSARADRVTAYRVCLWSRLANRVILCLVRDEGIATPEQLREAIAAIPWEAHLPLSASLAVDFHGRSEAIRHTRFGAQTVKDGVVDRLQARGLPRPSVDLKQPDLRCYANLHRGRLVVGIDLSGVSLHRRGYRRDVGHAPLKENLAAALLLRAGWPELARQGAPLVDPLCGAGTLLIEAAMMAADMAPGLARDRFGFHGWAGHDEAGWRELRREAEARASIGRKRCRSRFYGFDQSPAALAAAKANAMRAGIPALIELRGAGLGELASPQGLAEASPGLLITNPPYGERLGELPELVTLYARLGERVRDAFPGWQLAVFTANPDLGHRIGLRAHKQYALRNGPLEAKLLLMAVPERQDGQAAATPARSQGAQMFANRLEKNRRRLKKWLKKSGESCYRLYDADMPEYAMAVDVYADWVHVQEYAAPKSVDVDQAQKRLFEALAVIPEVLEVAPTRVVVKRRQRQSGRAQYEKQAATGERFEVREGPARLWINLRDYLDTGLFLDHRPVRRMLGEMAAGRRFLNLFCYTGAATVQAALGNGEAGGATESVSVDLSNTYLQWARDNFALNRLDPGRHRVVREDCLRWLERANAEFDLIFMDPPTFSNSKKMEETLDIQRDHGRLVRLAMARLAPGGTLVFSNNQRRFKLDADLVEHYAVKEISGQTFDPDFVRNPDLHHVFLIRHRGDGEASA